MTAPTQQSQREWGQTRDCFRARAPLRGVGDAPVQAFDQAGHVFEMAVEGTEGRVLDVGTLNAGERVRGVIAFDMPRGDTTLIMSDDSDQTVTALRVPD